MELICVFLTFPLCKIALVRMLHFGSLKLLHHKETGGLLWSNKTICSLPQQCCATDLGLLQGSLRTFAIWAARWVDHPNCLLVLRTVLVTPKVKIMWYFEVLILSFFPFRVCDGEAASHPSKRTPGIARACRGCLAETFAQFFFTGLYEGGEEVKLGTVCSTQHFGCVPFAAEVNDSELKGWRHPQVCTLAPLSKHINLVWVAFCKPLQHLPSEAPTSENTTSSGLLKRKFSKSLGGGSSWEAAGNSCFLQLESFSVPVQILI